MTPHRLAVLILLVIVGVADLAWPAVGAVYDVSTSVHVTVLLGATDTINLSSSKTSACLIRIINHASVGDLYATVNPPDSGAAPDPVAGAADTFVIPAAQTQDFPFLSYSVTQVKVTAAVAVNYSVEAIC